MEEVTPLTLVHCHCLLVALLLLNHNKVQVLTHHSKPMKGRALCVLTLTLKAANPPHDINRCKQSKGSGIELLSQAKLIWSGLDNLWVLGKLPGRVHNVPG